MNTAHKPKPDDEDDDRLTEELDERKDDAEITVDASNRSFTIRMGRSDVRLPIWWLGVVLVFALILAIIGALIYFLHLIGFHPTQIGLLIWAVFLFVVALVLCAAALGVILIIKEIEEVVPMPRRELYRWRLMLRALIVTGSTFMLTAGSVSYATADRLRLELAKVKHVPIEAIQIDHDQQQFTAGEGQQPGELIITRKPDGTMQAEYFATLPTVQQWEKH